MRSISEVAAEQSPWSASQLEADGNCDAGLSRIFFILDLTGKWPMMENNVETDVRK
jgi:hypothetical protein